MHLLQRDFAQPKQFAMQNGQDVKEGEGDDFDPQQGRHRHRVVMGAGSQVPMLRQFAKGIVFDFPAQVPPIPNGGTVVAIQISGHHPKPVLLLGLGSPLSAPPR